MNPLVSIIIPVYNGANYLKEAIDSALAQTYPNVEILVINDGSRDDGATERIALSYGERIRYFSKPNGGVSTALNLGIQEMRGEYFSWLSHDDTYLPDKISTQVEAMQAIAKPVIVYSDFERMNEQSETLNIIAIPTIPSEAMPYHLIVNKFIHGCTLLIPKICFEDVGGFDENLRTTQDYDLWFRLAQHYEFRHIAKPLIRSRWHREQGSFIEEKHQSAVDEYTCDCLTKLTPESLTKMAGETDISKLYTRLAREFQKAGYHKAQRMALEIAAQHLPGGALFTQLKIKVYRLWHPQLSLSYWVRKVRHQVKKSYFKLRS